MDETNTTRNSYAGTGDSNSTHRSGYGTTDTAGLHRNGPDSTDDTITITLPMLSTVRGDGAAGKSAAQQQQQQHTTYLDTCDRNMFTNTTTLSQLALSFGKEFSQYSQPPICLPKPSLFLPSCQGYSQGNETRMNYIPSETTLQQLK
uniref:Uncharacterized protein n=1 Tax=Lygus hesperus TaxID=30085 RepID=A0A146MEU4_LYGHE